MLLKLLRILTVLILLSGIIYFFLLDHLQEKLSITPEVVKGALQPVGTAVATYKKIPAYQNGTVVTRSHGKHYADDGYYYGQKYQPHRWHQKTTHWLATTSLKHHFHFVTPVSCSGLRSPLPPTMTEAMMLSS